MASTGQRYIETSDTAIVAGPASEDHPDSTVILDTTTGKLYVVFGGNYVLVGGQV